MTVAAPAERRSGHEGPERAPRGRPTVSTPGTSSTSGDSGDVREAGVCGSSSARDAERPPSFEEVYDEHAAFVWRSLRRLGVPPGSLDDATQDVFVVVHRKLSSFEGRSSVRSWLFGIVVHVSRTLRRTSRRKRDDARAEGDELEGLAALDERTDPALSAERREAIRVLYELLDALDDERREVFVMAELEGLTGAEIAEALGGINVNTVHTRLRAARADLAKALARRNARCGAQQRGSTT
jgi:RNA polymerase sigma-70 factor (ECF subfamily)